MDRKTFLKKNILGMGSIVALPLVIHSCKKNDSCPTSPEETKGPFPIKSPADYVLENIVSDRTGVALLMTFTIKDSNTDNCGPLAGAFVDVWHCDKDGNYSEYGSVANQHFLRGRQTTDTNGQVSFITIYPGWYRGRAPHIHIEVLNSNGKSLLVTQTAFPDDISEKVYSTSGYNGKADTTNDDDNIFSDSLDDNMADSIVGDVTKGFTLLKTIII
jgi:protocatechuate 3,4-dioxygenase beta subunit